MHFAGHSSSSTRDDAPESSSLPPSRSEATISDVALSNTMRTTATTTTVVPVTQSVTLTLILNSKSPVRHGISGAPGATSRWADSYYWFTSMCSYADGALMTLLKRASLSSSLAADYWLQLFPIHAKGRCVLNSCTVHWLKTLRSRGQQTMKTGTPSVASRLPQGCRRTRWLHILIKEGHIEQLAGPQKRGWWCIVIISIAT